MTESSDQLSFYKRVTGKEKETRVKEFEDGPTNDTTQFTFEEVDRAIVLDKISQLPEEMLDLFDDVDEEDEEEVTEMAEEENLLKAVNGDTIQVFEDLVVHGLSNEHNELTEHHFEDLVDVLSFEVLFEAGTLVIDMSLNEDDRVTGFRDPGSDKSS